MNQQELSERDLLIQLTTEVGFIKESLQTIKERLDRRDVTFDKFQERLIVVEQRAEENTKLRNLVYTSLVGLVIELVLLGLNYMGVAGK